MSKAWPVSSIRPEESLAENARRILRVRAAEYYSYEPIVDHEQAIEPLHNLRIAAKRLRYTLELFRPVFREAGEANIERVKAIQEELGNIHDADVRIVLIQEELVVLCSEQIAEISNALSMVPPASHRAITTSALRPPPDDPRRGLLSLLGRQLEERHAYFLQFNEHWHRFEQEGMRAGLVALSSLESQDS